MSKPVTPSPGFGLRSGAGWSVNVLSDVSPNVGARIFNSHRCGCAAGECRSDGDNPTGIAGIDIKTDVGVTIGVLIEDDVLG